MRRRQFLSFLGGAAAWPMAAQARHPAMPVIGFLHGASRASNEHLLAAFHEALTDSGFVEGKNVSIEYRWADHRYDQLPALAADLTGRSVDVIYADGGTVTALAAKAATTTIPVVFRIGADPVKAGLVNSFSRPGGNVTGVTFITDVVIAKRFELLSELLPNVKLIGILLNPNNPNSDTRERDLQAAARALERRIEVITAGNELELETAFAHLGKRAIGALLVQGDPFFFNKRDLLATLAGRHALPTIYEQREYVDAGGLVAYGTSLADSYRRAASYVARVLLGERPADLPVERPTKFELVINLKAAKALALSVPATLLARADEVIE
ncbi:MAG: ABC transporter substrate-binding protein [Pseudorhodoplanes sp.]|uniref:ABC transporter substrate-binding protein n=1 Tax=Pseudorhodoplanes sp. TaxID=1934341 RepID=UPI003D1049A0